MQDHAGESAAGRSPATPPPPEQARPAAACVDTICPICGARLIQVRCKVVCRSATCVDRIVYNCCEF